MTQDEIQDLAGHRDVPPWVVKLVGDAIAKEREKDLFLLQTNAEAYASEGKQATANLLFAMANIIRARGQA